MAEGEIPLITKEVIIPGDEYIPLEKGTKLRFHFQAFKGADGSLMDDSEKYGKPIEIMIGNDFDLRAWEDCLQGMSTNEISKFIIDKSLLQDYPYISKAVRDALMDPAEKEALKGTISAEEGGMGYKDLDDFSENPYDMEFIFELLSIELAVDNNTGVKPVYENQKLNEALDLKEKGNDFFSARKLSEAEDCFRQSLDLLDEVMKEYRTYSTKWWQLKRMRNSVNLRYCHTRRRQTEAYKIFESWQEEAEDS